MNKQELIKSVKYLINVDLIDEPIGKPKKNYIRVKIEADFKCRLLSLLYEKGVRWEKHFKDYYFLIIK